LLAGLPDADFRRIAPTLTTIPMRVRQVLHRHGEPLQYVYFPNGGVVSITAVLPDGAIVEAATVGDEGMVGIEAFLDAHAVVPGQTLLQVPDTSAERMSVNDFRQAVANSGAFRERIGRYTQVVMAQMVQATACNALHPVAQRCARWLLMTHDRMHGQDFELSHEFLAVMLGVARPSVSIVAATLQDAGLIRYKHGQVTVKDRKGLEDAACVCYPIMRGYFESLRP
jgi:CRP-like cAMP-binding protein